MSESHVYPIRDYLIIFGLLMILMVLTVLFGVTDFMPAGVFVAYLIAATKAVLIILYFMHVKQSSRLTWVFAGASFLWVVIFFVFLFADYAGRPSLGRADAMTLMPASHAASSTEHGTSSHE